MKKKKATGPAEGEDMASRGEGGCGQIRKKGTQSLQDPEEECNVNNLHPPGTLQRTRQGMVEI